MADETTSINHTTELTLAIRYTLINEKKELEIKERFLKIKEVESKCAENIAEEIIKIVNE